MRVVVDLTKCQGYAQCAFLAPTSFQIQGDEGLLYDPEPDAADELRVRRAAAACPVQAIQLDRLAEDVPRVPLRSAPPGRIVIVGASLAGLRAAEALREEGYTGRLTLVDDELHGPYDRPPLSKYALAGRVRPDATGLPHRPDLDAQWRLGVSALALDLPERRVRLSDGSSVPFDRLLIATGVRARPWPDPAEAALDGLFVLRTRDDAIRLHERLAARPGRVLVVGAGFTGSEVASTCRVMGLDVTVAEAANTPLEGALGSAIGAVAADLQREHGVDLRCGVTVERIEGDGRVERAYLSDGSVLDVGLVVAALGGVRNVEWLQHSGLAVGPWGLACDAGCRAFDVNGLVTDDIFVAGDVARAPNAMFGYQFLALEHWANAVAQAEVAAHNMVSDETDRWPHLHMPQFWSLQFGTNIKSVGVPTFADQVVITQGSVAQRRFAAVYGYRGRLTGAVTFNHAKWLPFYERLIEQAAPFPPDFTVVDGPDDRLPVPSGVPDRALLARDATVVVTGHRPTTVAYSGGAR
ncbi:FAD-dependent oxidoreductase [Dactylosporangium matsuzakiense]|uniref:Pyridine nucleotide-disulfide oxidoreductase n=1 Tax=Dactylosporangium matsuzakiense TaxID=53360 RepID=A0A9W6NM04_9ACTN|nr:FAD-dependent oxidoreductase [Dactylosporangium matsuzakiense]UWZ43060.1 FAD-dependent oxidoreductase [Dactylosporangium matsuzakiense]GLL02515.1 pyridine nucleotide-disulfide oxidoreductase [Dactylosporangium matsuzakiense]